MSTMVYIKRVMHACPPHVARMIQCMALIAVVKLGPPTRPILVDKGAPKRSILVKLEETGGPILVHFGPPSRPLWAPGRPIFANFGHFWGAKTSDFGQTLTANSALFSVQGGPTRISKQAAESSKQAASKQQAAAASSKHARNGEKSQLHRGASDSAKILVGGTYGCEGQPHKV